MFGFFTVLRMKQTWGNPAMGWTVSGLGPFPAPLPLYVIRPPCTSFKLLVRHPTSSGWTGAGRRGGTSRRASPHSALLPMVSQPREVRNSDDPAAHLHEALHGQVVKDPGEMLGGDVQPRGHHGLARLQRHRLSVALRLLEQVADHALGAVVEGIGVHILDQAVQPTTQPREHPARKG